MKCRTTLIFAVALCSANAGLASDLPSTRAFYCQLHYSKNAYGKEVKRVLAHTGVETKCKQLDSKYGAAFWDKVRDLDLQETETGFQGKLIAYGSSSTYYPCALEPVVQFWVDFTDGSSRIETPTAMEVVQDYSRGSPVWGNGNPELAEAVLNLKDKELSSIQTVSCFSAWSYGNLIGEFNEGVLKGASL